MSNSYRNPPVFAMYISAITAVFLLSSVNVFAQTASSVTGSAVVTDIHTVTLHGTVNPQGYKTSAWFEWGTASNNLSYRTNSTDVGDGNSSVSYSYTLHNLDLSTTYYYRSVAYNKNGTVRGGVNSFRTGASSGNGSKPSVSTGDSTTYADTGTGSIVGEGSLIALTKLATLVTETTVQLNGLALPGDSNVFTTGWFEWGTTQSVPYVTPIRSLGTGVSLGYAVELTGLQPSSTYYYRAVVQNQNGIARGSVLSFRTRVGEPVVSLPSETAQPVPPIVNTTSRTPAPAAKPATVTPKPEEATTTEARKEPVATSSIATQNPRGALATLFAGLDFFDTTLGKVIGWLIALVLVLLVLYLLLSIYGCAVGRRDKEKEAA